MIDKQIIGGRGSAKSYTTLNTIEVMLENEELKKCYKNNLALLDFEEMNTTKLVNKVMKLEKTLTEIKEIAENVIKNVSDRCIETTPMYYIHKQIIQKISEVEDE